MRVAHQPPPGLDNARAGPGCRIVVDGCVVNDDVDARRQRMVTVCDTQALGACRLARDRQHDGEHTHDFILFLMSVNYPKAGGLARYERERLTNHKSN